MNRLKNLVKYKNRTYKTVPIMFAIICIIMAILCFQYYKKLQDTVAVEGADYLQEISKQIGVNASKTMMDNFSVLDTMATVLKSFPVDTYESINNLILEQQKYWKYQNIMLIDENGVAHDANGNLVTINVENALRPTLYDKKRSLSPSQVVDGVECIVFAIPLEGVRINGTDIKVLAASYNLKTFDKILAMTVYSGKGYSSIIQKNGSVVIRSSEESAMETGYNILNTIANYKIYGERTMNDVKTDIVNDKSGQVEFLADETRQIMVYTPLIDTNWCLLTFVPVNVVNQKSELMLRITLSICGIITVVFACLFAFLMVTFYYHRKKLEQIAYVDPITGGNTIGCFYGIAKSILEKVNKTQYAFIYVNIEKFKVLNEQFGRDICDEILRGIDKGIGINLKNDECVGRLSADNFCVLVEYTTEQNLVERFNNWYNSSIDIIEKNCPTWISLIVSFGVFVVIDRTIPLTGMVDRAKLAINERNNELHGRIHYRIFDERVRSQLFREKQLEDMMVSALKNNEFQVYLQPKYHTQDEKIGGAEALVRWISPTGGMIYPDEFISLFERNGFVIQLDMWVFEEVCKTIKAWIDDGREPFKISVNCSRNHLKNLQFITDYCDVLKKYGIEPRYIEIELTENTVFEDFERLAQIINEIHAAGLGCSMDDFGSGYSSLNLIQDIPVDVIKLDKIFFHKGLRDLDRTRCVVGNIISMARELSIVTVAEGVEELLQVEMLKELKCDYIQGYYFARPMTIPQFEVLAFGKEISSKVKRSSDKEAKND